VGGAGDDVDEAAWASFRAKNADALATAGSHGHAFLEYRYLADNGPLGGGLAGGGGVPTQPQP